MGDSKFEPGKMDITDQEKTFAGFMRFATNTTIGIIVFLILLYLIAG
ncbi:MAG: aa3-type cytochrome c oxidase subunit IV [Pseudomonadota bacterium]